MTTENQTGAIGSSPDAFEEFYREHLEAVQRFVARRIADPHAAADLTADIFLAAIVAAESYRPDAGMPRAWLFGIARHVVLTEHRRRARHGATVSRLGGRRELQPDAIERAVERIDAARESRAFFHDLGSLPPRLRAVLELVALDGLSVADAAAVLGIRPNTARVRLHRARQQITTHQSCASRPAATTEQGAPS